MEKQIQTYYHDKEGYNPFFITENWQVAQLNYMPELGFRSIHTMEKHLQTDEVFILTKGTAILIAAEETQSGFVFELIKMELGVTYNIPQQAWHNIAMDRDGEVIIIEKSNTHLGDFVRQNLNTDEEDRLKTGIELLMK